MTPAKAFVEHDKQLFTSLGNTFTIRAIDQYSGIQSVKYGVNAPANEEYEGDRTVRLSDPGNQVIQYRAVDNLGNETSVMTILVSVDDKHPVIDIKPSSPLRNIDGNNYARRATAFTVISNDEGSGVQQVMVRIDGSKEWQVYSNALHFATEQEHVIEAKAIDAVGNESEIVTLRFIVDDNPPISELKPLVSTSANQEGSVSDADAQ